MKSSPDPVLRIGAVRVEPALDQICKDGATIKLEPRTIASSNCWTRSGKMSSMLAAIDLNQFTEARASNARLLDPKEMHWVADLLKKNFFFTQCIGTALQRIDLVVYSRGDAQTLWF